jgi:hypothetical protein
MVQVRQEQLHTPDPVDSEESPDTPTVKDHFPIADTGYTLSESPGWTPEDFQAELDHLRAASTPKQRRYESCPTTVKLAFLVSALSRPALRLTRPFFPFPSDSTLRNLFREQHDAIATQLVEIEQVHAQIDLFIKTTKLPTNAVVSVAVDAIAMNPDRSYLPTKKSDYAFVVFVQPLDRRYRCFPLHVKRKEGSGNATAEVRKAVSAVCEALSRHGIVVKYKSADGDKGHNEAHAEFFHEWYPLFEAGGDQGLKAAIDYVAKATNVPVGDPLHMWKNWCNKVKNHPVVLCPDSLANAVRCEDLQALLRLGKVLTDRSPTGKMRDAYALKLFSLTNCAKCIDNKHMMELMYLLPWALQEEVIRSPNLPRQDRLEKAILSFKLLHHFYRLSTFEPAEHVGQRWREESAIEAITFAEDSEWPRILNSSLALIEFVLSAEPHWSFARIGTHCLENFFGFVRRNSLGDDRFAPTIRIITKSTMVYQMMHELGLDIKHSGRDNIGGTVIKESAENLSFNEEAPEIFFQSLIHIARLEIDEPANPAILLPLGELKTTIANWASCDHHVHDSICNADASPVCNCRITARNIGAA